MCDTHTPRLWGKNVLAPRSQSANSLVQETSKVDGIEGSAVNELIFIHLISHYQYCHIFVIIVVPP